MTDPSKFDELFDDLGQIRLDALGCVVLPVLADKSNDVMFYHYGAYKMARQIHSQQFGIPGDCKIVVSTFMANLICYHAACIQIIYDRDDDDTWRD